VVEVRNWTEREVEMSQKAVSPDGVEIAYEVSGHGDTALLFIHGGYADRTMWRHEHEAFAEEFQIVSLDLAGHGSSGHDREAWTPGAFAADVECVMDACGLSRVILIGNSMGGPVALEVARRNPDRILAVIGADTLHDVGNRPDPSMWLARFDAMRKDFQGFCASLEGELFHPDTDKELMDEIMSKVRSYSPERAVEMLEGFASYDIADAMAAVSVPVACINADLYKTNTESNRRYAPEFDAVIMEHASHYPMLERPQEFNRHLREMITRITQP
jgi:pimeloyl-ACP methyl ester carboxylesterase